MPHTVQSAAWVQLLLLSALFLEKASTQDIACRGLFQQCFALRDSNVCKGQPGCAWLAPPGKLSERAQCEAICPIHITRKECEQQPGCQWGTQQNLQQQAGQLNDSLGSPIPWVVALIGFIVVTIISFVASRYYRRHVLRQLEAAVPLSAQQHPHAPDLQLLRQQQLMQALAPRGPPPPLVPVFYADLCAPHLHPDPAFAANDPYLPGFGPRTLSPDLPSPESWAALRPIISPVPLARRWIAADRNKVSASLDLRATLAAGMVVVVRQPNGEASLIMPEKSGTTAPQVPAANFEVRSRRERQTLLQSLRTTSHPMLRDDTFEDRRAEREAARTRRAARAVRAWDGGGSQRQTRSSSGGPGERHRRLSF